MNYYRLLYSDGYSRSDSNYSIVVADKEFDMHLFIDGCPFPYEILKQLKFEFKDKIDIGFPDYQMTAYPIRMISEKMYRILLTFSNKYILFHPVEVRTGKDKYLDYYIIHILNKINVLDKKRTVFAGRIPRNPKVKEKKLKGIHIFNYKEFNTSFCISEDVKNELEKNNITGYSLELIS